MKTYEESNWCKFCIVLWSRIKFRCVRRWCVRQVLKYIEKTVKED